MGRALLSLSETKQGVGKQVMTPRHDVFESLEGTRREYERRCERAR